MIQILDPEPTLTPALPQRSPDTERIIFGRFLVLPSARTLLLDGTPVCIGARAFDLLVVLLGSRGELVSKEEIISYVWPTTTVDESNLRFQMTLLRRALGAERDRIKTITGRGYMFIESSVPDGAVSMSAALPASLSAISLSQQHQAISHAFRNLVQTFARYPDAFVILDGLLADAAENPGLPEAVKVRGSFAPAQTDALAH